MIKSGEQQKFANMLAQSIHENGMVGREDEQLRVLTSIQESLSAKTTNVSEQSMRDLMSIYSNLVSNNPALAGSKGAEMVSSLSDIFNNDASLLLAGLNTGEYVGSEGKQKLMYMRENDPAQFAERVFKKILSDAGGDKERAKTLFTNQYMNDLGVTKSIR